ncbi:lipopolysaccharide biosynthesis protein [Ruegeria lacuscaerulensis]|uniref:lipopolysaccharide biosynthesis protein n=1 Tax=Ruegeria lacuscaerulensis TaxID=55218 RepID=UPI00147F4520|nr:oligosaccharide flippase family protein [Ruegeria lacuscaerulensis]
MLQSDTNTGTKTSGRRFALRSLAALCIKCGAAGLSFLMFVALSRSLGDVGFGQFSFAFSLATILAIVGSIGQRSVILRFASFYLHEQEDAKARGVLRFSYAIVLSGSIIAALGLALMAYSLPSFANQQGLLWSAALLTVALALAEFQPNPQRAAGSVWIALVPRDILFRLIVISVAALAVSGWLPGLNAVTTVLIMSGLLIVLTLAQSFLLPLTNPLRLLRGPADFSEKRKWLSASWGMWGNSVVNAAGRNVAIVILGGLLPAAMVGAVFAALRTAMVLELFLMAINIVAAPLLAAQFGRNDHNGAETTCRRISLMLGLPTLASFLIFVLWGDHILELFGPGYAVVHPELIVISFGYLVSAFSGPTTQIMEMSGHERVHFVMLSVTTGLSLAALPFSVSAWGTMGAAFCISLNLIALNCAAYFYIFRKTGISSGLVNLSFLAKEPRA